MSQVTSAHAVEPAESPLTPESWGKLGMWIFLAGDAMTFGALLAGYGALRAANGIEWPDPTQVLGINLTAFMTFLLICSSVTMVKGLSAIAHGNAKRMRLFLLLTILGGVIFLGLQAYEWTHLIVDKKVLFSTFEGKSSLFGTTFYSITGFHGAHVTGGVIYLSVIVVGSFLGKPWAKKYNIVEIAGLYWHFVDLIWILVFTFIYLIPNPTTA
ncbi:heme-copper oxidase subunit III [candidate division KSB1 bacterium]|nr:heme-copper oxidase subunit III [candidate division KSB1 bacterium]NIR69314.1 heme-copper oxidase subunit III [candidate division KSB1 bacterium]NIS22720.1 heme-copper oxidase subunit III [candidate division KSB1 bacterium]NIT69566.1 heme-copper oxidase subunit III [candidate division KSB1 bacterium]NIU23220.1 heme-copper oxidase subunit III [candidate division KSB1 bacterium]